MKEPRVIHSLSMLVSFCSHFREVHELIVYFNKIDTRKLPTELSLALLFCKMR